MICAKSKAIKEYCTNPIYIRMLRDMHGPLAEDLIGEVYLAILKTKNPPDISILKFWIVRVSKNMVSKTGEMGKHFFRLMPHDIKQYTDYDGMYVNSVGSFSLEQIPAEESDIENKILFEKKYTSVIKKLTGIKNRRYDPKKVFKAWQENDFNAFHAAKNSKFGYTAFRTLKEKLRE